MDKLELILYNVGQGLSVSLIEYPEKYVTQIDLGSSSYFSPLEYLSNTRGLRTDVLYITHPHADHLSDIRKLSNGKYCPDYLYYQIYDWDDVINKERTTSKWIIKEFQQLLTQLRQGDYSGAASLKHWFYTPQNAKKYFGDSGYINNSSLFIVYSWKGFKVSVCGDLETPALSALINNEIVQNEAKNTDLLIASHHGHSQGYVEDWPALIGKPYLSLLSVQQNDPNTDVRYSSAEFAKGWNFNNVLRYALTTRKDGTIIINMQYNNGQPTWSFSFD